MQRSVAAKMFDNLVTLVGGKDAAAATIESAIGHPISIGTLTKIKNGDAEVPMLWAWALMDAAGSFVFDKYRAGQHDENGTAGGCVYALTGEASKEHGEAVEAGLKAARSSSIENWSRAAVEHHEAAEKHREMARICESRAGVTSIRTGGAE